MNHVVCSARAKQTINRPTFMRLQASDSGNLAFQNLAGLQEGFSVKRFLSCVMLTCKFLLLEGSADC